jgi:transposase
MWLKNVVLSCLFMLCSHVSPIRPTLDVLPRPADHPPDCPFRSPPRHRLPRCRYSPQSDWAPLSDDEWAVLAPFLFRSAGPGRPVRDPRGRLDAVFWLAAHARRPGRSLPPWHALPPEFGKPDTVSRQFRRWAEQGLWSRLLRALADPDRPGIAVLRRLESWICRSYRHAWRVLGVPGVALARRLGFLSALRGPPWCLPDPDLSGHVHRLLRPVGEALSKGGFRAARALMPRPDFFALCGKLLKTAGEDRRRPALHPPLPGAAVSRPWPRARERGANAHPPRAGRDARGRRPGNAASLANSPRPPPPAACFLPRGARATTPHPQKRGGEPWKSAGSA